MWTGDDKGQVAVDLVAGRYGRFCRELSRQGVRR